MRFLPVALLVACAPTSVHFECPNGELLCGLAELTETPLARAGGVTVDTVELNQGIGVILAEEGEVTELNAPVVAGRAGVVHLTLKKGVDWEDRAITARFLLMLDEELIGAAAVTGEPAADGTLDLPVEPIMLAAGEPTWQVQLFEADEETRTVGHAEGDTFPEEPEPLLIEDGGPHTRILVVPVSAGGVPNEPNDDVIELWRSTLFAQYPVRELVIELGEPYEWEGDPNDLGGLLNAMTELRGTLGLEPDWYVFGQSPTAPGGLSWLGGANAEYMRVSVGSDWTMVHEVGHAQGRSHAPCPELGEPGAPDGIDPAYPHDRASIGTWGWDIRDGTRYDPELYVDYMSYCGPGWVSDYTWAGLLFRQQELVTLYSAKRAPTSWTEVWFPGDGRSWRRGSHEWYSPPVGEAREVTLLDADGRPIEVVEGKWTRFSHGDGGVLLLPGSPAFSGVVVDGEAVFPAASGPR